MSISANHGLLLVYPMDTILVRSTVLYQAAVTPWLGYPRLVGVSRARVNRRLSLTPVSQGVRGVTEACYSTLGIVRLSIGNVVGLPADKKLVTVYILIVDNL